LREVRSLIRATIFWRTPALFFFQAALATVFLGGCQTATVRTSRLGAVTDEIVAAAQKVTGQKTAVGIHRGVPGKLAVDSIYLSLANPRQELELERALGEIAKRHKLSIVEVSSGDLDRFDFALEGSLTHTVRVVHPLPGRKHPASAGHAMAMLAIIVDDLGSDRSAGEAVIALSFPLTVAVLPNLRFSTEIAEQAHRRGDQVLLHLPMEAQSAVVDAEPTELRVGMSLGQVRAALSGMLETVPYVAGVNNHEGSRATSDPALMAALMPALRERGLFFVDSRTAASTVAYATAERSGVAAASRKVFLDDVLTSEAIVDQLKLAARGAIRDGSAIAIGHPHPTTIAALAAAVPSLEGQGVRLVFASDLVH
jgi:polysaccharide deacetylase 2 family uncharacterized protein YibQ